jgi:hypothetical protein
MKRYLAVMAAIAVLAAGTAGAQGMGAGDGMGVAGGPLVADDGTVFVIQPVIASGATTPSGMEVVAVAPAGAVAWRHTLGLGAHDLAIAGDLVLVAVGGKGQQGSASGQTAATSTVVALQLTDGLEVWSATVDGNAVSLSVGGGNIYVLTVTPQAQTAAGAGTGAGTGGMRGRGGMGGNGGSGAGMGGSGGQGNGGGQPATRSLVALSPLGAVLWSLPLAS